MLTCHLILGVCDSFQDCANPDSRVVSFEWLFSATLRAEKRPDNKAVTVGFYPKNTSSAGGALNHCATGPPLLTVYIIY